MGAAAPAAGMGTSAPTVQATTGDGWLVVHGDEVATVARIANGRLLPVRFGAEAEQVRAEPCAASGLLGRHTYHAPHALQGCGVLLGFFG